MWNAELDESQTGIKIAGSYVKFKNKIKLKKKKKIAGININNLRYADDTILMDECEGELKNVLMRVNEQKKLA